MTKSAISVSGSISIARKIKILAAAMAVVFSASSVFAVETGGLISNNTKINQKGSEDSSINQSNDVILWLRSALSKDGNSYFITEGTYNFEYDGAVEEVTNTVDLDLFKFVFAKGFENSDLTLSLGRFSVSDLSGLVFSQNADGVLLQLSASAFDFSVYGGYTGLLNANSVTMLDGSSEGAVKASGDSDKVYDLASKYAVGSVTFTLPSLFANQSLSLQGLGTFHVEDEEFTRLYGTVSFGGPLSSEIYYGLNTTFGFSAYDGADMEVSNLSQLSLSYFPEVLPMSLSLSGTYASGNQGGLKPFTGFTSMTAFNSAESPEYSGIVKGGLSFTYKPMVKILISGSADAVFNAADGADKDEISYKGFQYGLGADWQVLTDFSAGLNFYQYVDSDNSDNNKVCLQLKASITF